MPGNLSLVRRRGTLRRKEEEETESEKDDESKERVQFKKNVK